MIIEKPKGAWFSIENGWLRFAETRIRLAGLNYYGRSCDSVTIGCSAPGFGPSFGQVTSILPLSHGCENGELGAKQLVAALDEYFATIDASVLRAVANRK